VDVDAGLWPSRGSHADTWLRADARGRDGSIREELAAGVKGNVLGLWAMPTYALWITALTGGLAGALLTLLGQSFLRRWNRPILEIVFRNEPGCIVPIEGWLLDKATGIPLKDPNGNLRGGKAQYLRLKIENRGKTFAKNASVCVTKVTYSAAGTGEKTFAEEVFELSLAPTAGNPMVFNLAACGHRFVDFVHTELDDENRLKHT
jgi:hypothetical protein